ncbi:hypothetical protein RD792_010461 [Penstemon davidsonii]|uniref:Glycosyltransferase n=1 Tax=Penstemon davidsonii TaxID=160366 RepID=A0ABR0D356_9LAMI|nr:hypothetical protein RD792_010461 [Penstemon davidsonii]
MPLLPPQLHTTKNLPTNLLPVLFEAFQNSSSNFSDIINSLKPDLLIYDFFQPWAPKLALSQGIPCVFLATSGATTYAFFHHFHTNGTSSAFPYPEIYLLDYEKVIRARILENIKPDGNDFASGNFKMSSEIVLVKSCKGIEGKYIDYLSILCNKKIVPTGPLVSNTYDEEENKNIEIVQWLNGKNKYSTVYISFGSENFLSNEQTEEVAKGLEICNANFIWVIRFPLGENRNTIEDALPLGFLDRVKDRGIIVQKWAPQTKILSHPSIGGFLSHCGWSSITESMYFGVPIIALPFKLDQPINARLAVEAGIGVEVERGENGHFVREDIAKAIDKVVSGDNFGECLRSKARELSEKMKNDEEQELTQVTEQLTRLCVNYKHQKGT